MRASIVLGVVVLVACLDSADPIIGPVDAERVFISVPCQVVAVSSRCEATATAFDENGREIVKAFQWSVGNPERARIENKPGFDSTVVIVTGLSAGNTTLRVEVRTQPEVFDVDPLSVVPDNNPF